MGRNEDNMNEWHLCATHKQQYMLSTGNRWISGGHFLLLSANLHAAAQSQCSADLNILGGARLQSSLAVNAAIREAATWNANMASSFAHSRATRYLSVMVQMKRRGVGWGSGGGGGGGEVSWVELMRKRLANRTVDWRTEAFGAWWLKLLQRVGRSRPTLWMVNIVCFILFLSNVHFYNEKIHSTNYNTSLLAYSQKCIYLAAISLGRRGKLHSKWSNFAAFHNFALIILIILVYINMQPFLWEKRDWL